MAMIPRKAGPAIAAGCTMVLKPASATPLSALALAELGARAGLPPGVFSVVPGSAAVVGDELATNPTIRKLTFTGSTEVGKELMAKCAGTVKKVVARARRQRAADRLRRRRPRRRSRGSDRLQVPQHGSDMRLRQPDSGAGRDPRRLRRALFRGGERPPRRPRLRRRGRAGPADRRGRRCEGRRSTSTTRSRAVRP